MRGVGGKLWPPSSPRSMSYAGLLQLHRGPWVGDRFDVRMSDDVRVIEDVKDEVDGDPFCCQRMTCTRTISIAKMILKNLTGNRIDIAQLHEIPESSQVLKQRWGRWVNSNDKRNLSRSPL
jgi:hypothetical protein